MESNKIVVADACANDTEVIDNLLKETYNKHYIPSYPVRVRVDMWVQGSNLTRNIDIFVYRGDGGLRAHARLRNRSLHQ